jgi:uncharacterized alkaline shock family protein YloU
MMSGISLAMLRSIAYSEAVLASIAGCRNGEWRCVRLSSNNLGDSISKIFGKIDVKRGVKFCQKTDGAIKITYTCCDL